MGVLHTGLASGPRRRTINVAILVVEGTGPGEGQDTGHAGLMCRRDHALCCVILCGSLNGAQLACTLATM